MKNLFIFDREELAYRRVNVRKFLIFGGISFVVILFLCSFVSIKCAGGVEDRETVYLKSEHHVKLTTSESFTKEKLVEEIKKLPFKYKSLVYCQALTESGNFKSPVFKENNNLFGIRPVKQRMTTSIGENIGWANYENWKSCLIDRLLYESRYMSGLSREQYKKYLDQVYSEGGGYSDKLEEIIKQNKIKELFKDER